MFAKNISFITLEKREFFSVKIQTKIGRWGGSTSQWRCGGVVALQTAEAVVLGSNLAFLTVEKLRRQADSLCLL